MMTLDQVGPITKELPLHLASAKMSPPIGSPKPLASDIAYTVGCVSTDSALHCTSAYLRILPNVSPLAMSAPILAYADEYECGSKGRTDNIKPTTCTMQRRGWLPKQRDSRSKPASQRSCVAATVMLIIQKPTLIPKESMPRPLTGEPFFILHQPRRRDPSLNPRQTATTRATIHTIQDQHVERTQHYRANCIPLSSMLVPKN